MIAPFWDDLCVDYGGYNQGRVYTLRGGSAPNRYFVIEWHQVSLLGSYDLLTFEVVLHESGDIVAQQLDLSGYVAGATVGIENALGVDGLSYVYNSPGLAAGSVVRFRRPDPSARVQVWPLYQGSFTYPGEATTFELSVHNTGELGADTYDLLPSSPWPVLLYQQDGVTPLTDTDSDGVIDTGSVAQGATVTVVAKVETPGTAVVGQANTAQITVRSSLDTTKSQTPSLRAAVPAPFAQVFRDSADGAMSLELVQPAGEVIRKATPDWTYGSDMAVTETAGGFVHLWDRGRSLGSVYVQEIEYVLWDRGGTVTRPASRLTDHSGATLRTYDYDPAVAAAPDGRIGVTWQRYLVDGATSDYNYNIYFAVLDAAGNLIHGPANLTNNPLWGHG